MGQILLKNLLKLLIVFLVSFLSKRFLSEKLLKIFVIGFLMLQFAGLFYEQLSIFDSVFWGLVLAYLTIMESQGKSLKILSVFKKK